jgi:hypothetical protein
VRPDADRRWTPCDLQIVQAWIRGHVRYRGETWAAFRERIIARRLVFSVPITVGARLTPSSSPDREASDFVPAAQQLKRFPRRTNHLPEFSILPICRLRTPPMSRYGRLYSLDSFGRLRPCT